MIANDALNDPDYARFAWGRYKRILKWMALLAAVFAGAALLWLGIRRGEVPLHMGIAVAAGVFFTTFLTAALMGLVFLSSGTGHDDQIVDPFAGEADR